jgi:CubicO group peptidase (beta-lactamase class C family)
MPVESSLDRLFDDALHRGLFSAASLLVAGPSGIAFERTWGTTRRGGPRVTPETGFDLASLTKPMATASLYLWETAAGRLDLEDPLARFFPRRLLSRSTADIRLRHLLSHSSGLPAYRPYFRELIQAPPEIRRERLACCILSEETKEPPGRRSRYSDLGYILLGFILEHCGGRSLDDAASEFFRIAGCRDQLGYRQFPPPERPESVPEPARNERDRWVATEQCSWRNRLLQGEVHDENAFCLGGVAGHAGLFGTARSVWLWLARLWRWYRGEGAEAGSFGDGMRRFWTRQATREDSRWTLGFDTPSGTGSSTGSRFSERTVGHLGFTGTSFWLDLEQEIAVILLTNRVHPSRYDERIRTFRPLVHDIVMAAWNTDRRAHAKPETAKSPATDGGLSGTSRAEP